MPPLYCPYWSSLALYDRLLPKLSGQENVREYVLEHLRQASISVDARTGRFGYTTTLDVEAVVTTLRQQQVQLWTSGPSTIGKLERVAAALAPQERP